MPKPDNKITLWKERYYLKKEIPNISESQFDLCKDCYKKINGDIRNMIIEARKQNT